MIPARDETRPAEPILDQFQTIIRTTNLPWHTVCAVKGIPRRGAGDQDLAKEVGTVSTTGVDRQTGQQMPAAQQGIGSPISNEAYNVLSALHAKLEGQEAYRKYQQSGGGQLWQQ